MTTHHPRKRFGQNFLVDKTILHRIVALIRPKPTDHFIEIGPGHGALTKPLLSKVASLTAIELDRDLVAELQRDLAHHKNFTLLNGDALEFDFGELLQPGSQFRVVGNLPYNISTPLLFHLMQWSSQFTDMHFMLQREVAERMAAHPGSKIYGRLSVMVQYHCNVTVVLKVPNSAFFPVPKVASQVIRLTPHLEKKLEVKNIKHLEQVVTTAFSHRRKRLGNALKTLLTNEQIAEAGVDPDCRPETISLEGYCRLSDALEP